MPHFAGTVLVRVDLRDDGFIDGMDLPRIRLLVQRGPKPLNASSVTPCVPPSLAADLFCVRDNESA